MVTGKEALPEGATLDPANLIEIATSMKVQGNDALKKKQFPEAAALYEKAVATLDKADGKPMYREDVEAMLKLKAVLYSNLAQALLKSELWRQAIVAATDCLRVDEKNPKAMYRRILAKDGLKQYEAALEDFVTLESFGSEVHGMDLSELVKLKATIQGHKEERDKLLAEESDDEDESGMISAKQRFDQVIEKYDMKDEETAGEIADWLTRGNSEDGTCVTLKDLERRWDMEEEDAVDFLAWIHMGQQFQKEQAECAKNF